MDNRACPTIIGIKWINMPVLQFVFQHYNSVRPHQGIGNIPIGPWEARTTGNIVCDTQLHGLLKSFRRAA
jgi:hypothetical protein